MPGFVLSIVQILSHLILTKSPEVHVVMCPYVSREKCAPDSTTQHLGMGRVYVEHLGDRPWSVCLRACMGVGGSHI